MWQSQVFLIGLTLLAAAPSHQPEADNRDPAVLIIPSGTEIPVTLDENVEIKRDQIGNSFAAHVTRDVMVDGLIGIPSGAAAELALVENQEGGSASFRVIRISIAGSLRPVRAEIGRAESSDHGLSTAQKTGIGAAAGGLIGVIAGGGSGLLKGAVVGAGGGLVWGLLDKGGRRVEQGSTLAFKLLDPIQVG